MMTPVHVFENCCSNGGSSNEGSNIAYILVQQSKGVFLEQELSEKDATQLMSAFDSRTDNFSIPQDQRSHNDKSPIQLYLLLSSQVTTSCRWFYFSSLLSEKTVASKYIMIVVRVAFFSTLCFFAKCDTVVLSTCLSFCYF